MKITAIGADISRNDVSCSNMSNDVGFSLDGKKWGRVMGEVAMNYGASFSEVPIY